MRADLMFSSATLSGFVFGLGLIFSLGPQNLMLIRAGMLRNHPMAVASTGYVSEIALVAMGIGGLGTVLTQHPTLSGALQLGCAGFLAWCGLRVLIRASRTSEAEVSTEARGSRFRAIGLMLAVTWLNPLAWLEVMFLVGVFSSGYASEAQIGFAFGFLSASAIKFYGWSLAGVGLSSKLKLPAYRRKLDAVAGIVFISAAAVLSLNILNAV